MAIKLIITEERDPSSKYERSFIQDRVIIGRSRSADVCLPAMAVSTRHAEIRLVGADYAAVDLESLNGTTVNGNPVLAYRNRILKNGDTIEITNFRIHFQMGVPTPSEESRDKAVTQAREILANILARSGSASGSASETQSLYLLTGPARGTRIELPDGMRKCVLGRGKRADVAIDDPDISREHAAVVVEAAGIFVHDIQSRNGVFLDGVKVDVAKLEAGDQFTIGSSTFLLEHPAEKSLGLIFDAPEEDTASFMLAQDSSVSATGFKRASTPDESPPPPEKTDEYPQAEPEAPVIGPADPLIAPTQEAEKQPTVPSTPPSQPKTDIGLIIVGSLILIAAVAGLIYLFR